MADHDYVAQARTASGLTVLLGLWLIASPWIWGYVVDTGAFWNSIATGIAISAVAAACYAAPLRSGTQSWLNVLLGCWTIASPWIFGFVADGSAFWDNVAIGIAAAVLAIWSGSARLSEQRRHPAPIAAH